jgi:hypothetical protein
MRRPESIGRRGGLVGGAGETPASRQDQGKRGEWQQERTKAHDRLPEQSPNSDSLSIPNLFANCKKNVVPLAYLKKRRREDPYNRHARRQPAAHLPSSP